MNANNILETIKMIEEEKLDYNYGNFSFRLYR